VSIAVNARSRHFALAVSRRGNSRLAASAPRSGSAAACGVASIMLAPAPLSLLASLTSAALLLRRACAAQPSSPLAQRSSLPGFVPSHGPH